MSSSKFSRVWACKGVLAAAAATVLFVSAAAMAQIQPSAVPPNERNVYLVRQDQSDCQNSNVPNTDGPNVGGFVKVIRGSDGNTQVNIALTGTPNTTLKCVRLLGDIKTDDEGVASASFSFRTNETGNVFAFDSYPEGAPSGNKFQSAQVKF